MALDEGALKGGGSGAFFSCHKVPCDRGGADFFRFQGDLNKVAEFEWGGVVDLKRNDRPCCRGIQNRNSRVLKKCMNCFLNDHCRLGKVGHSSGIGVSEGNAALKWACLCGHGGGFINSLNELERNLWPSQSGIRIREGIVIRLHACEYPRSLKPWHAP